MFGCFFVFKQKTAYEMRISDWSSDVCSSDLGCTFEIVPLESVTALLPELKTVSDAWLREKHVREKRFSIGWFNPAYISRFPAAGVRKEGSVLAFATIWQGGGKQEISIELMRHLQTATRDVIDLLLTKL